MSRSPSPSPSTPYAAKVAGMNCIGPCAPAYDDARVRAVAGLDLPDRGEQRPRHAAAGPGRGDVQRAGSRGGMTSLARAVATRAAPGWRDGGVQRARSGRAAASAAARSRARSLSAAELGAAPRPGRRPARRTALHRRDRRSSCGRRRRACEPSARARRPRSGRRWPSAAAAPTAPAAARTRPGAARRWRRPRSSTLA